MKYSLRMAFLARGFVNPEEVSGFSLLSTSRLRALLDATRDMVEGQTAEIGCASGGTSRLIATVNNGRRHWACDTFEGLKDASPDEPDMWNGQFENPNAKPDVVRQRLADLKNVVVVEGYFPDCAPQAMRDAQYALVHLDVDTYASMRACWDFFVARMAVGGIIALDDVIGRGTSGAKKFWSEVNLERFEVVSEADPQVIVRFLG